MHSNSSHILESEKKKTQWQCQSPFSKPMSLLINIKNGIFYAKNNILKLSESKTTSILDLNFEIFRPEIFEICFFLRIEIFKPCFSPRKFGSALFSSIPGFRIPEKKPLCNRHKIRIKIRTDILYRYSPN